VFLVRAKDDAMIKFQCYDRCNVAFFSCSLGFLLATASIAQAQPNAPRNEPLNKAATLKALLKERRELLESALKDASKLYSEGKIPFSIVAKCQGDFLKFVLDLDGDPEERTAALQSVQTHADKNAEVAQVLLRGGKTRKEDSSHGRALALDPLAGSRESALLLFGLGLLIFPKSLNLDR
jgi:hypothetical protein